MMKDFLVKKEYSSCRICNSKELTNFFHVDKLPMPEGHVRSDETEYVHDLDIFWCSDCGMVQTQIDLDLSDYYTDYAYTTGASSSVQNYMRQLANKIVTNYQLTSDSLVLEIGSGDGKQLSMFQNLGCNVLGVEPSKLLTDIAEKSGIETINSLFDTDCAELILRQKEVVDAIIIQYTFDHLQDPLVFLKNSNRMLSDKGVLVIEVHDFKKIYERNEALLRLNE